MIENEMKFKAYYFKNHPVKGKLVSEKILIGMLADRRGARIFAREMRKIIRRGDMIIIEDMTKGGETEYDYPEL
jgi:hypothetical protein